MPQEVSDRTQRQQPRAHPRRAVKIATFNINNVNRRLPNLLAWLETSKPDVACLQELKAEDRAFPEAALGEAGYHAVWKGRRSWNGVAILARGAEPVPTRRSLPGDASDKHARYIEAARSTACWLSASTSPMGTPAQPGPKFDYKLAWFERLITHAAEPIRNRRAGHSGGGLQRRADRLRHLQHALMEEERAAPAPRRGRATGGSSNRGWTDSLRTLHPTEPMFTFWEYFRESWSRDAGLRLDHLLLNGAAGKKLVEAGVDRDVRGAEGASDHAPAWIRLATASESKRRRKA